MELCFGLSGDTAPVHFQNWMTFLLRECISKFERIAYYNGQGPQNELPIKTYYNNRFYNGITYWLYYYTHRAQDELFIKRFLFTDTLITRLPTGRLEITYPFPTEDSDDSSVNSD